MAAHPARGTAEIQRIIANYLGAKGRRTGRNGACMAGQCAVCLCGPADWLRWPLCTPPRAGLGRWPIAIAQRVTLFGEAFPVRSQRHSCLDSLRPSFFLLSLGPVSLLFILPMWDMALPYTPELLIPPRPYVAGLRTPHRGHPAVQCDADCGLVSCRHCRRLRSLPDFLILIPQEAEYVDQCLRKVVRQRTQMGVGVAGQRDVCGQEPSLAQRDWWPRHCLSPTSKELVARDWRC